MVTSITALWLQRNALSQKGTPGTYQLIAFWMYAKDRFAEVVTRWLSRNVIVAAHTLIQICINVGVVAKLSILVALSYTNQLRSCIKYKFCHILQQTHLCFAMEYAAGGDLLSLIQKGVYVLHAFPFSTVFLNLSPLSYRVLFSPLLYPARSFARYISSTLSLARLFFQRHSA